MSTIDIRDEQAPEVNIIKFANEKSHSEGRNDIATAVYKGSYYNREFVFLHVDEAEYVSVRHQDIDNLIKALQKAKELWT